LHFKMFSSFPFHNRNKQNFFILSSNILLKPVRLTGKSFGGSKGPRLHPKEILHQNQWSVVQNIKSLFQHRWDFVWERDGERDQTIFPFFFSLSRKEATHSQFYFLFFFKPGGSEIIDFSMLE
jgi:hypothetical protein